MVDKKSAEKIKNHGLKAISELSSALIAAEGHCSPDDMERLRRGVGLSIGKIETDLLSIIYNQYPDLDDLG